MQLLGILTSRNFAGLSILTSEINPENFRYLKDYLFHRTICKIPKKAGLQNTSTVYKLQSRLRDFTKFTG